MERWAGKLIEKLEATDKPKKKKVCVTDQEIAALRTRLRSKMNRVK
jgi:hypothetical protein